MKEYRIILGSGSPRRRELLAGLDLKFTVDTGNTFEEKFDPATPHREVPLLMARGKSDGFHRPLEGDELLITADTMVLCDGLIMGKPHTREQAVQMLRDLSGREHEVITGVVLRTADRRIEFSDSTTVEFSTLSDDTINYYIDNYKPFDKAGGYGIQEWIGYSSISSIKGSYFNVMGLPVHRVYEALEEIKR